MKAITKLYLKFFLINSILYGLGMTMVNLFSDDELKLKSILLSCLFYGIMTSLIFVSSQISRVKNIGVKEITDQNLGVSHKINVKSELNKSKLIEKLKTNPLTEKMKIVETENGVILNKGNIWKYWGNEINITVQNKGEKDFSYQISSSPKSKIKIIDFGENLKNVNRIKDLLEKMPSTM